MNEIATQPLTGEILNPAPPQVWIIEKGEYEDRHPVGAVRGTESDAQHWADNYNIAHPQTLEEDRARVGYQIPYHDAIPVA